MNIPLLLALAVIIIVIALSFKAIKGVLRIAFSALGVLFITVLILSIIAYMDAKQAKTLLEEGDKTVLYAQGDQVLSGVAVHGEGFLVEAEGELPENIDILTRKELDRYEALLADEEFETEDELVILVRDRAFNDQLETIDLMTVNLSKDEFSDLMASEEPKELLIDAYLEAEGLLPNALESGHAELSDNLTDLEDDELQSGLFLMALSQTVEEDGASFVIQSVKDDEIIIKPDFLTIKILKRLPKGAFSKSIDKALSVLKRGE